MQDLLIVFVKGLKAMFGQNALWEAVKTVIETRGKIKIAKFDLEKEEGALLREIQYDIREAKASSKLKKINKRAARKADRKS